MSEIVRAGIISVDEGQTDAAKALGMTRLQTMRRVVLPQAMRVIIPPTGNETISMLKNSSLVSVIAVTELLYAVQLIYSVNYKTIPLLIVASIWYLAATTVLSIGQYYLERHYGRGGPGAQSEPLLHRIFRGIAARHDDAATSGCSDRRRPSRGTTDERADGQSRPRAQALRAASGPEGSVTGSCTARGRLPDRTFGLGQVDLPALRQPPREDRRWPPLGRRRAGRLPAGGRQGLRAAGRSRSRASARRSAWSSSASTSSPT